MASEEHLERIREVRRERNRRRVAEQRCRNDPERPMPELGVVAHGPIVKKGICQKCLDVYEAWRRQR